MGSFIRNKEEKVKQVFQFLGPPIPKRILLIRLRGYIPKTGKGFKSYGVMKKIVHRQVKGIRER